MPVFRSPADALGEAVAGRDHPDVARDCNNLASLLKATGETDAAKAVRDLYIARYRARAIASFTSSPASRHSHPRRSSVGRYSSKSVDESSRGLLQSTCSAFFPLASLSFAAAGLCSTSGRAASLYMWVSTTTTMPGGGGTFQTVLLRTCARRSGDETMTYP